MTRPSHILASDEDVRCIFIPANRRGRTLSLADFLADNDDIDADQAASLRCSLIEDGSVFGGGGAGEPWVLLADEPKTASTERGSDPVALPPVDHDDEALYLGHCHPVHAAVLAHGPTATADSLAAAARRTRVGTAIVQCRVGGAVFFLNPQQARHAALALEAEVVLPRTAATEADRRTHEAAVTLARALTQAAGEAEAAR